MKEKEIAKKNLFILKKYEFMAENNHSSELEYKWKEFIKQIDKPKHLIQSPNKDNISHRIHLQRSATKKEIPARKDISIKETVITVNNIDQTTSTSYSNKENVVDQIKKNIRIKREVQRVLIL